MFGLGFWEISVILVIALVVLGPKKLPEMAKSLGKGIREFRSATEDFKSAIDTEMSRPSPKALPQAPTPAAAAAVDEVIAEIEPTPKTTASAPTETATPEVEPETPATPEAAAEAKPEEDDSKAVAAALEGDVDSPKPHTVGHQTS